MAKGKRSKKDKPSRKKWRENYNAQRGLKHRRKERREKLRSNSATE